MFMMSYDLVVRAPRLDKTKTRNNNNNTHTHTHTTGRRLRIVGSQFPVRTYLLCFTNVSRLEFRGDPGPRDRTDHRRRDVNARSPAAQRDDDNNNSDTDVADGINFVVGPPDRKKTRKRR